MQYGYAPHFDWLPGWMYPAWQAVYSFGFMVEHGINPFTGSPWW